MVRQFCDVTNRNNLLALLHALGELDAVLVIDADGTESLLVAVQLLVVQRAEADKSEHVLLLLHQVHHFHVLADNLGLEAMTFVAGLPVCIEFLQICLAESNYHTASI